MKPPLPAENGPTKPPKSGDQREAILSLRKSVGAGGPNFAPDVSRRGWNDALVAVLVSLGLDTEEGARAALKRAADDESARTQVAIDRINAREAAQR